VSNKKQYLGVSKFGLKIEAELWPFLHMRSENWQKKSDPVYVIFE